METESALPSPPELKAGRWYAVGVLAFFAALTILLYAETISAPFVYDDISYIVENQALHLKTLDAFSIKRAMLAGPRKDYYPRPLFYLSLGLNYYFAGLNPVSYHLVSLTLHILSAWTFWLWLRLLLQYTVLPPQLRRFGADRLAMIAALIWLVHPVQVQVAALSVHRLLGLMTVGMSATIYFYLKARLSPARKAWLYYLAALVAYIFALGVRETAAVTPLIVLLMELLFLPTRPGDIKPLWRSLILLAVMFIPLAFFFPYYHGIMGGETHAGVREYTLLRFYTQFRVIVFYISLLCWPSSGRLSLDYDFGLSSGIWQPSTTALSLLWLLIPLTVAFWRARSSPFFSFAVFWFFLGQALDSSLVPAETVYLKRLYLPSMGFALFVTVYGLDLAFRFRGLWWKVSTTLFLLLFLILPALCTSSQAHIYRSEVSLWRDTAAKAPQNFRPHLNLAWAYQRAGQSSEALKELSLSEPLAASNNVIQKALIAHLYWTLGDSAQAFRRLDEAAARCPSCSLPHERRALYLMQQGHDRQAEKEWLSAINLGPTSSEPYFRLGELYYLQGQTALAAHYLTMGNQADPENYRGQTLLARALLDLKQPLAALQHVKTALTLNPWDPETHGYYAEILQSAKRFEAAEAYLKNLSRKVHDDYASFYFSGLANEFKGKMISATADFQKAVRLKPDFRPAVIHLARTLMADNRYREAALVLEKWRTKTPYDYLALQMEISSSWHAKDFKTARTLLERYLSRFPRDEEAQRLKNNLP